MAKRQMKMLEVLNVGSKQQSRNQPLLQPGRTAVWEYHILFPTPTHPSCSSSALSCSTAKF